VMYAYRYLLGTIGGAIAAVLTYGLFLHATPAYPLGQLNPAGYAPMAITIGVFITVTNLISSIGTHSRIGGLYRPPARRVPISHSLREVGSVLNNRNFLVGVAAGMLSATAAAMTQGLAVYFNTFMFHLPSSNIVLLVVTQLVSAPIAFLIAPAAARRWGKRAAYLGLFAASLVVVHAPIALRLIALLPANGSPLLLPLLMAANTVAGLLATASAILNTSMISDIVEDNQARTGRRSEGLVLFSDRLLLKVASSLAAIVPGILLAVVHFPATAHPAKVDPTIVRNLALLYLVLAVCFSLASMLTWFFFRIDRGAHARNLAAIAARRAVLRD
jgi:GPH family glycoside/pentoside/hexuronide:cation symporter